MWLCEQVNSKQMWEINTESCESKNTGKIKSHPPQLCASSQCSFNPQTPPPAGFRQWGKGLPAPKRNACWCHASCKPSNPWIINSGLQTISASAAHCEFLTLDTIRACLQGSPYITQHTTIYCIPWDKSNWFATGSLYMQETPSCNRLGGQFGDGTRISV